MDVKKMLCVYFSCKTQPVIHMSSLHTCTAKGSMGSREHPWRSIPSTSLREKSHNFYNVGRFTELSCNALVFISSFFFSNKEVEQLTYPKCV